jgi:hypothetical protein
VNRVHVVAAVIFTMTTFCDCGSPLPPSSSAAGDWSGRVAPLHFDVLSMHLTQQGSDLIGTACYFSDIHLVFTGVPVLVNYPRVLVSAPAFNNFEFRGTFQSDGTIAGESQHLGSAAYPMTVTRAVGGGSSGCPSGTP